MPQESTYRTAAIVCCGCCWGAPLHRYRRAFAWITAISAQHLDVLDGGREVFLNLHTPQATPSCLVKPKAAGARKGALDQVLARADIAPGLRRAWLRPHPLERGLLQVTRDRAAHLVASALITQRAGGACFLWCGVVDRITRFGISCRRSTTSVNGFKVRLPDCERPPGRGG